MQNDFKIEVLEIDSSYKIIYSRLFELYWYQLSSFWGEDIGDNALFIDDEGDITNCWDGKWEDKEMRYPFLIKVNGKIAGFAIIDKLKFLNQNSGHEIGEFFILKKYSGKGIGKYVSKILFDKFKGKWEIRIHSQNIPGISFWKKVVKNYSNNKFEEISVNNEIWEGPVLYFEN